MKPSDEWARRAQLLAVLRSAAGPRPSPETPQTENTKRLGGDTNRTNINTELHAGSSRGSHSFLMKLRPLD